MYTSAGWYVKSPIRKFHAVSTRQPAPWLPENTERVELRAHRNTTVHHSSRLLGRGAVNAVVSTPVSHGVDSLLTVGPLHADHLKKRELSVGVITGKQAIADVQTALEKDQSRFAIDINAEFWWAELGDMLAAGIPTNTLSGENTAWAHWE